MFFLIFYFSDFYFLLSSPPSYSSLWWTLYKGNTNIPSCQEESFVLNQLLIISKLSIFCCCHSRPPPTTLQDPCIYFPSFLKMSFLPSFLFLWPWRTFVYLYDKLLLAQFLLCSIFRWSRPRGICLPPGITWMCSLSHRAHQWSSSVRGHRFDFVFHTWDSSPN